MFTKKEKLLLRLAILTRQLGNLSGSLSFYLRTPDNETVKKKAFKDHLKCDVADLLNQVVKLAEDLGFNRWEVEEMGYKRYEECKNEFRNEGRSQYFI